MPQNLEFLLPLPSSAYVLTIYCFIFLCIDSIAITHHQMILFTVNGDYHRKPELDIMQKLTDTGEHSPNGCIYITDPASIAQRPSWKRGRKNVKARTTGSLL